jgi:hypothetical protein
MVTQNRFFSLSEPKAMVEPNNQLSIGPQHLITDDL